MKIGEGILSDEERQATCKRCGKPFTQYRISSRFYAAAGRVAGAEGKKASELERIPDGFVPLHCVPCERIAIAEEEHRLNPWLREQMRRSTEPLHSAPRPTFSEAERTSKRDRQMAAD